MANNVEMIDIFDENENHIGVKEKKQAHEDGDCHRTTHLWIVNPEKKTVIFQLRSHKKSSYPGVISHSVSGHVDAGETPDKAVLRELKEELGVDYKQENLIFLFNKIVNIESKCQEFAYTYFIKSDRCLKDYTLQESEVDSLFEMDIEKGIKFFKDEIDGIKMNGVDLEGNEFEKKFKYENFVPFAKKYYLDALIKAEELINDEKI